MRLVPATSPPRRQSYPTNLTDEQLNLIEPLVPENHGSGQATKVELREVVNTLLYMKQTGCQWRYLPHDFLPRSTVHYYFEKWTHDGTSEAIMGHLQERPRQQVGRERQPTAGVIDSQTAETARPGFDIGGDGGK